MKKSYSQAFQDKFAYDNCRKKTYIEIGAAKPVSKNNTHLLEQKYGWKGFSIEKDKVFEKEWVDSKRENKIYWADAIRFNYKQAAIENNLRKHIGYLSCDIDPPENTFRALKKVISSGFTFDVITVEDDRYHASGNWHKVAEQYLKNYNYKVAVRDVTTKKGQLFETWFINDNYYFETIDYIDWKGNLEWS